MSTLLAWVIAASTLLAPGRSHDRLATAIATRAEAEAPLFTADEDRRKTAALLVAIAFRESSLRADAVGDFARGRPTSFCAFQLHLPGIKTAEGWSGADVLADPDKCVTVAMRLLRDSMKSCPSVPIGVYAAGPLGCTSAQAARISRDRVALAHRLIRDVTVPAESVAAPTDEIEGADRKDVTTSLSYPARVDRMGACGWSGPFVAAGHMAVGPWQACSRRPDG